MLENGIRIPLRPGHVAVLFRKFTNAHVYLEAMHRQGIPYLTDGERHFYRRQEVIDMVNVLRVLDDPSDAIAIVGILRSSLGGVPDQDIMELARLGPRVQKDGSSDIHPIDRPNQKMRVQAWPLVPP